MHAFDPMDWIHLRLDPEVSGEQNAGCMQYVGLGLSPDVGSKSLNQCGHDSCYAEFFKTVLKTLGTVNGP